MPGSVLIVAAYASLAVFAVGFLIRTYGIMKLPVHLRWELSPVPHEKGKSRYGGSYFEEYEWWTKPRERSLLSELVYMFLEIAFLKSVWEHQRRLWWFSFPFHFGMYLLIGVAGLFCLGGLLGLVGLSGPGLGLARTGIPFLAGLGYALGGVGALGLLLTRLLDERFKAFTTPVTLFNLVFLLAVFASGGCALVASDGFAVSILAFVSAVFTADLSVGISGILALHILLAFLFLAYLPFTQMMHFVAKYFTYHEVRWDDKPLIPGGRIEKEVLELLRQPVTWSGPHLKADGKKSWVDIATEEVEK